MQNVHLTTTCKKDYSPLSPVALPHALSNPGCLYYPMWWLASASCTYMFTVSLLSCVMADPCTFMFRVSLLSFMVADPFLMHFQAKGVFPVWWLTPASCTFTHRVSLLSRCDGWPTHMFRVSLLSCMMADPCLNFQKPCLPWLFIVVMFNTAKVLHFLYMQLFVWQFSSTTHLVNFHYFSSLSDVINCYYFSSMLDLVNCHCFFSLCHILWIVNIVLPCYILWIALGLKWDWAS